MADVEINVGETEKVEEKMTQNETVDEVLKHLTQKTRNAVKRMLV